MSRTLKAGTSEKMPNEKNKTKQNKTKKQKQTNKKKTSKIYNIIFAILHFSHTNILTKLIVILSTLESSPLDAISDVHQNGSF